MFITLQRGADMKVLNFGSLNLDYVYSVDNFLRPGETKSAMDPVSYTHLTLPTT